MCWRFVQGHALRKNSHIHIKSSALYISDTTFLPFLLFLSLIFCPRFFHSLCKWHCMKDMRKLMRLSIAALCHGLYFFPSFCLSCCSLCPGCPCPSSLCFSQWAFLLSSSHGWRGTPALHLPAVNPLYKPSLDFSLVPDYPASSVSSHISPVIS